MDGVVNTIVTDIEETIKKYNLDCNIKVHSFHISSPNERNKIILALSENGDIVQKWMCIYKNGTWTSSSISVSNFTANDVCNETNCLDCYLCELADIEECHIGGTLV
jgi:hypothetical protein